MSYTDQLIAWGACQEGIDLSKTWGTVADCWANCQQAAYMLWMAGRASGAQGSAARKAVTLAACAVARLGLPSVPSGETRPLAAVQAAESYANGTATLDAVRNAILEANNAVAAQTPYSDAAYACSACVSAAAVATADTAQQAAGLAAGAATRFPGRADVVRQAMPNPPVIQ